jgi:lysozyme
MNLSKIRQILLKHEGFRLKVYDDATGKDISPGYTLEGHPTIGIGRALDVNGISKQEAMILLDTDINLCIEEANKYFWFKELNEVRQAVIISMIFNLGASGFSNFKRMIKALQNNDFIKASEEMLNSSWALQLPIRSKELALMMLLGK